MSPRIALVAAEPSGDQLGASLIRAVRMRYPEARFEGVGGETMAAEGCVSRIPLERLSVMGLVEVVAHLPELLRERKALVEHWRANPPDLFIGVDAPDFNLGLAKRLKEAGIKTAQYVAPTVWAWRQGRVRTLRESVDLVLSIFPFEEDFLRAHQVPVVHVGHPLAQRIGLDPPRAEARAALGLDGQGPVLALLPGSRRAEVEALAEPFLRTASWCRARLPGLQTVTPLASDAVAERFARTREAVAPDLPLITTRGRSHQVLAAADVVLTASGTATLEALLHQRPMVVGYRVHWLSYFIARHLGLVKTPWVAMANILAGEMLAPEYLQRRCTPEHLGPAVLDLFDDRQKAAAIRRRYRQIHEQMRCDTEKRLADALEALLTAKT